MAPGESALLGQYLLRSCWGQWTAITGAAGAGDVAEMELELHPSDTEMQSLPGK
jgi:hypothetical protein